jgi:hypothetical protein
MSPLQQRIAAVTDTTANLIAQLRELDLLRERVREAQLSAKREPRPKRLNGNGTSHVSHSNRPNVNLPTAAADLPSRRL